MTEFNEEESEFFQLLRESPFNDAPRPEHRADLLQQVLREFDRSCSLPTVIRSWMRNVHSGKQVMRKPDPILVFDHFQAAASLPAVERKAYLAAHCGDDAVLRAAVEGVLAAYDQSVNEVDQPAPAEMGQTQFFAFHEQPGTVVAGRYKLLEEIGEGGMGTVWVAEQSQPIRRKVALKLIKAGMDSKNVLARFEAERQALAVMDHPNIARVLDGGLTEAGRPFFVMEYVKGVPITEYCDGTRMSVADRLNLFVQVCHAVQHAHQKGIIHRDLKPSNILVAPYDDKPVTKVIDFGLAKAMHQPLTERTLHTAHETVLGTPLYMSPEQAQFNNLDVDTRSDIYSLGVLLYELLTGTTPVEKKRFKLAAWDEIRRIIRDEEPPRPSTRLSSVETLPSLAAGRQTDPARLTKLMRGELDWIVMKSLEKDRARRYQTANGFAMDIQRYLAGETVLAAPPSVSYQLRKFGRKHRVGLAAAAAILLLLGASAVAVVSVQARYNRALEAKNAELATEQAKVEAQIKELAQEKTKVQSRLKLAQDSIAMFHTGVSEDMLLKNYQFKELRDKLLTKAALFYGQMAKLLERESDAESRRALGEGYFQVGDLTDKIGSQPEALEIQRKALAIRRQLAAETGADIETQLDVARSLSAVGSLLRRTGDLQAAREAFEEQRDLADRLVLKDSTNAARIVLAQSYIDIGILLGPRVLGRSEESLDALRKALDIHQQLAVANKRDSRFEYKLASNHREIGRTLLQLSKPADAIPETEKARDLFKTLAKADSSNTDYQVNLARCYDNLAAASLFQGKPDDALKAYRASLAIYQNLVIDHAAVTEFQLNMAIQHVNIGFVLREKGNPDEAKDSYESGLEILQKLAAANPAVTDVQKSLAWNLDEIGWLLSQTGRPEGAITYYTQEEVILQQLAAAKTAAPDDRERLANCQTNSADALRRAGKLDKAREACESALVLRKQLVAEISSNPLYAGNLAETYLRAGQVRSDMGKPGSAQDAWNEALRLYKGLAAPRTEQLFFRACCHAGLSGLALKLGSRSAADRVTQSQLAIQSLREAVKAGYTNPDAYRTESALDPLRDDDDFKKLIAELEKKQADEQKP